MACVRIAGPLKRLLGRELKELLGYRLVMLRELLKQRRLRPLLLRGTDLP